MTSLPTQGEGKQCGRMGRAALSPGNVGQEPGCRSISVFISPGSGGRGRVTEDSTATGSVAGGTNLSTCQSPRCTAR